jgi:hypothetical protein
MHSADHFACCSVHAWSMPAAMCLYMSHLFADIWSLTVRWLQEFLNAFLGEGEDGEAQITAAAAGACGAPQADGVPDAQGPDAAAAGPSQPPVDMFADWAGADAAGDEVLAEALSLLPDLEQVAANTCAKYESVPGFFPPGFWWLCLCMIWLIWCMIRTGTVLQVYIRNVMILIPEILLMLYRM